MTSINSPYVSVQQAADAFSRGEFVLLIDDANDSGGLMACAAEACDTSRVNDMCTHARGLVCVGISRKRAVQLGLELQSPYSDAPAYTLSIEATTGVTTGISAADRARTIEVTIDPTSGPEDVVSPGHLFPVAAHPLGVLARRGPAEAVVDLAKIAGTPHEAGAYCHVLSTIGDEANQAEMEALARELDLPLLRMSDLVAVRTTSETLVRRVDSGDVPTAWGTFSLSVWEDRLDQTQHLLMQMGDAEPRPGGPAPLVRVHSQCLTGDVFKSHRCDCGEQLDAAMQAVSRDGQGAVLYLRQEGRGIGLVAKLKAYALQDRGRDTVEANEELGFEADMREYGIGAQILHLAGFSTLRLMTNNPRKISGLEAVGLKVSERVPLDPKAYPENLRYLRAKKQKLGHMLPDL